jgi:hypothetical protein
VLWETCTLITLLWVEFCLVSRAWNPVFVLVLVSRKCRSSSSIESSFVSFDVTPWIQSASSTVYPWLTCLFHTFGLSQFPLFTLGWDQQVLLESRALVTLQIGSFSCLSYCVRFQSLVLSGLLVWVLSHLYSLRYNFVLAHILGRLMFIRLSRLLRHNVIWGSYWKPISFGIL